MEEEKGLETSVFSLVRGNVHCQIQSARDEFHVNVAQNLDEACKLLEVGFEYVTEIDGARVFRKRK